MNRISHFQFFLIVAFTLPNSNHALEIKKPYYEILHLDNHLGLYYDHLGSASLSNSEYTLLTYLNLTVADQKYDQLLRFYTRSMYMCTPPKQTVYGSNVNFCQSSLQNLQSRISVIGEKIETIKYASGNKLNKGNRIVKQSII